MAKVRVYELAKELGVESKVLVTKLQEMGEFVRSASSTVEAPVVRKLREAYPVAAGNGAAPAPAAPPARKPAARKTITPVEPVAAPAAPSEVVEAPPAPVVSPPVHDVPGAW